MANLLFCLTPGGSLGKWKASGTLDREMKPYIEYVRRGWKVKIMTFQNEKASDYSLPDRIDLVRFPHPRLLPLLPLLRRDVGRWADVIKTNQSVHCWHYVRAARFWKKPILLRCGYVAGEMLEQVQGLTPAVQRYQQGEGWAFRKADRVQVSTRELAEWVGEHYAVEREKATVVPNFVDTELFRAEPARQGEPRTVIAVGRMVSVKRFDLLIRACARAKAKKLTILGDGPDRPKLEALASAEELPCELPGQQPNESIPTFLNRHEVFAQLSEWEGHPKTLIEAMACGCACVVADSPGLANQVSDRHDALVCTSEVESVASSLELLFADPELRNKLGGNASRRVVSEFGFQNVFDREYALTVSLAKPASLRGS